MVKRSLASILVEAPDVDRALLDATTEEDILRHAQEDGDDPDTSMDGYVLVPAPADLRRSLHMTQEAFAGFLRVPVGTVRNWEQGRTLPDPAARTLLTLVAADPGHAAALLGVRIGGPSLKPSRARRRA